MNNIKIQSTAAFKKLWEAITSGKYKVIVLIGGSRSGKTWAIIQALIILGMQSAKRITGWRLKKTWAKPTIYNDFIAYLQHTGLYNRPSHNKTNLTYEIGESSYEFGGLDDDQKLHGFTQDITWMNEVIEAEKNSFDQLEMRTNQLMILDCNPSEEESWVYELSKRDDVLIIHTTFKDNAFIPVPVKNKILSYEPTKFNISQGTADEYKWSVYGLGLAAKKEGLIFPHYEIIKEYPDEARTLGYGLDFGFYPDPVAFAKVGIFNGRLVIDELIYETELNNIIIPGREELPSIQGRFKELNITRRDEVIADKAAKTAINELRSVGYNVQGADKYPGSVLDGIELMLNYAPLYVTEKSINTIRELKNYTRKKNFATGRYMKEPIDDFNHIIDLVRYVAQTKITGKKSRGIRKISYK